MSEKSVTFDQELISILEIMAHEGVKNAAKGLSGMIGEEVIVSEPRAELVPLSEVPNLFGGPEMEAVGIYILARGEMSGQIMLILPYTQALELVDLVMDQPIGTVKELGSLERSALAEVGNLTCTFFLNSVAKLTGLESRPSPPAVMVDMVGAILNIIVATVGEVSDSVLVLHAALTKGSQKVESQFLVIPEPSVLEAIAQRGLSTYE